MSTMVNQTQEIGTHTQAPMALRPKFGLKPLFVLLTVFAIGTAWFLQPQIVSSVTLDLDLGKNRKALPATAGPLLIMTTPTEDHCIRIGSPRIITDALVSSEQLESFVLSKSAAPVQWIYERIRVEPTDNDEVQITVVGDASEKQELQHLIETLAESYLAFLRSDLNPEPGEITQRDTGWTVNWRTRK